MKSRRSLLHRLKIGFGGIDHEILFRDSPTARFPERLDLGLGHAHVQFKTGDVKEAVATLRQLRKRADALCRELLDATFPEHPFAYNLLAALADAKGDKDESYRQLKLAGEKAPEARL